ncbi:HAMP domain-containing protein [Halovenus sp. WSH3]|uniref:HAMP domain-containing protein n=1 Tax=Halovenus carboxidivorans TaxID=2692199 RepID=A0A6B0T8J7_9EURY|nr:HAMP domain-containing protein [Halovenus carboxidivorans]
MDLLGITESVERKVFTAVLIQFLVTIGIFLTPFVLSGAVWFALAGALFLGAVLAMYNTILIVRTDFTEPVARLEETAEEIARGNLDVDLPESDQTDEIGSLIRSFEEMHAYLGTVSTQADALAAQRFDDPALDEEIPGEFGASLSRMADNLQSHTEELEEMTDRLERRSERLDDLVAAFGEAAERAQAGDLTATIDPEELETDEQQHLELVENYNQLVETLAETIREVKSFAAEVSAASDDAERSMDEIDDASSAVSRSVQEISDGAAGQSEDLQAISEEINTLSATVEEIAASADDAATTAQGAADRSRSGRESAEAALDELDELEHGIGGTADAVEDLAEQVGEIDEIVSFIEEIAEETNMLALNASIEAARADQSGDGFAVVADEVKSLAEETREYAGEISDRIATVQQASQRTVADVQEMESQVSESLGTIETALVDFEEIVDEITTVNQTMQEISDATDEQAKTTQEVVGMIDDVASVSEETTAEAENVAAAADQQASSVTAVTETIRGLSGQSDELRALLAEFTVADRQQTRRATAPTN